MTAPHEGRCQACGRIRKPLAFVGSFSAISPVIVPNECDCEARLWLADMRHRRKLVGDMLDLMMRKDDR